MRVVEAIISLSAEPVIWKPFSFTVAASGVADVIQKLARVLKSISLLRHSPDVLI